EIMYEEIIIFVSLEKRSSSINLCMVYFLMGVLFTYVAFENASEIIWNPLTIILLLIAALDFSIAFRTFMAAMKQKQNKYRKKDHHFILLAGTFSFEECN